MTEQQTTTVRVDVATAEQIRGLAAKWKAENQNEVIEVLLDGWRSLPANTRKSIFASRRVPEETAP